MEDEKVMKLWTKMILTALWVSVVSRSLELRFARLVVPESFYSDGFFARTTFLVRHDPLFWIMISFSCFLVVGVWLWFPAKKPLSALGKGYFSGE
jgi:hypothetical protein